MTIKQIKQIEKITGHQFSSKATFSSKNLIEWEFNNYREGITIKEGTISFYNISLKNNEYNVSLYAYKKRIKLPIEKVILNQIMEVLKDEKNIS